MKLASLSSPIYSKHESIFCKLIATNWKLVFAICKTLSKKLIFLVNFYNLTPPLIVVKLYLSKICESSSIKNMVGTVGSVIAFSLFSSAKHNNILLAIVEKTTVEHVHVLEHRLW